MAMYYYNNPKYPSFDLSIFYPSFFYVHPSKFNFIFICLYLSSANPTFNSSIFQTNLWSNGPYISHDLPFNFPSSTHLSYFYGIIYLHYTRYVSICILHIIHLSIYLSIIDPLAQGCECTLQPSQGPTDNFIEKKIIFSAINFDSCWFYVMACW